MDKNPFSFVFEHHQYPHARTLRTSATQKIKDSFTVFTGNIAIDKTASSGVNWFFQVADWEQVSAEIRLGLFDYLTLCIPYGVTWCLAKLLVAIQAQKAKYQDESDSSDVQKKASFLLRAAVHYAEYPVWVGFVLWNVLTHGLLRVVVSLLSVFFLGLPFSLLVAYGSSFYSDAIKQKAFALQGLHARDDLNAGLSFNKNAQDRAHPSRTVELIALEDFLLDQKAHQVHALFDAERYTSRLLRLDHVDYLVIEYPSMRLKFYAEINQDNVSAIDALARLNFANVDDTLSIMHANEYQSLSSQPWIEKSSFFHKVKPEDMLETTQTKTTFVNCLRSVFPSP